MKLLIVDDQKTTLDSLLRNIPWGEEGFDEVDTAAGSMEAKLSFQRGAPDILLCDIEMPVENGIELCRWVRRRGYATKIIFLTCYSDFQYAREAVELGASDYILQPTPYHTIRAKVRAVMEQLRREESKHRYEELGKSVEEKQLEIAVSLWRGYLNGQISGKGLEVLPVLPPPEAVGHLMLVQIAAWTSADAHHPWNPETMMSSLQRSAEDIFPIASSVLAANMEQNMLSLLLLANPGDGRLEGELEVRLQYLLDSYSAAVSCDLAIYVGELSTVAEMPRVWKRLKERCVQDVARRKGVFFPHKGAGKPAAYSRQFNRWNLLLEEQGVEAFEEEALGCLDRMEREGNLNAEVLATFCLDINRLIAQRMDPESNIQFHQKWMSMLWEASHSVESARELVSFAAARLEDRAGAEDEGDVVRRVMEYVQANLSEDIRREDIAEHVHLNGDYVNRIFKRETGHTLKSFIIQKKLEEARNLLQTTSLSVSSVAVRLGYNNFSHFAAAYRKAFGVSPAEDRKSDSGT